MATQMFHLDPFNMLPNLFICNTTCNYCAEMMALNVGRFAGLGVRHVPKYLNIGECGRVQECHKGYFHLHHLAHERGRFRTGANHRG